MGTTASQSSCGTLLFTNRPPHSGQLSVFPGSSIPSPQSRHTYSVGSETDLLLTGMEYLDGPSGDNTCDSVTLAPCRRKHTVISKRSGV